MQKKEWKELNETIKHVALQVQKKGHLDGKAEDGAIRKIMDRVTGAPH